jgi:hypothetical protein
VALKPRAPVPKTHGGAHAAMTASTISNLCLGIAALTLLFWATESATAQPGAGKLLLCGLLLGGIGLGLPAAL